MVKSCAGRRRPPSRCLALLIHGQVQREDAGQDQQVVLAGGDVDRVAGGQAEPAFGDGRGGLTVSLNGEFVAEQVAGRRAAG